MGTHDVGVILAVDDETIHQAIVLIRLYEAFAISPRRFYVTIQRFETRPSIVVAILIVFDYYRAHCVERCRI
jgi:hypothetical protein